MQLRDWQGEADLVTRSTFEFTKGKRPESIVSSKSGFSCPPPVNSSSPTNSTASIPLTPQKRTTLGLKTTAETSRSRSSSAVMNKSCFRNTLTAGAHYVLSLFTTQRSTMENVACRSWRLSALTSAAAQLKASASRNALKVVIIVYLVVR